MIDHAVLPREPKMTGKTFSAQTQHHQNKLQSRREKIENKNNYRGAGILSE